MFQLYQALSIMLGALTWTLLGQGALALMLGERRRENVVYRFFAAITAPLFWLARRVTPRFVADQHLGFVAFFLVLVARLGLYMVFYSQGWIPSLGGEPGEGL
jgi:hypothetical protein